MTMPKRGEIYYIQNDPPNNKAKCEQGGIRPAVIISNDTGNQFSPVVIVAYLTTKDKRWLPTHVQTSGCRRESTILCEQIATVSKDRIIEYAGKISKTEMKKLDKAINISLGLSQEGIACKR